MNIKTQLITLTLLIVAHANNTFAAQPAIPASLQAELKRIEDLPDHKVLTEVAPRSISLAEQYLRDNEDKLMGLQNSLASPSVKSRRSMLKYWTIKKELSSCPDGALKQTLQIELDEAYSQNNAHGQEEQRCADCIIKDRPFVAYNFVMRRHNALANQASILLAQKEKLQQEKAQWQQEKAQLLTQQQIKESLWQQEKAQLQAALNGYQLLEDGLQIEGVPNVPGGVKPKLKRSGSF